MADAGIRSKQSRELQITTRKTYAAEALGKQKYNRQSTLYKVSFYTHNILYVIYSVYKIILLRIY